MLRVIVVLLLVGCGPKPTDTSEMKDVNPCQEGEILQADGSCSPAGDPIEQPPESGDTGQDTGTVGDDTGEAEPTS